MVRTELPPRGTWATTSTYLLTRYGPPSWALLDTPSILSCPVTDFLESFLPALVVPMGTWLAGVFGHLPQGAKFQDSAPCSVW